MGMCMPLPVVTKEAVEAAFEGFTRIAWLSETPFTKATTNIAEVTEEFTQKRDICRDGHLFVKSDILVVAYGSMSGVEACHEDAA